MGDRLGTAGVVGFPFPRSRFFFFHFLLLLHPFTFVLHVYWCFIFPQSVNCYSASHRCYFLWKPFPIFSDIFSMILFFHIYFCEGSMCKNVNKAHSLTLNSAKTNILPVTRSPQPIPIHLNLGSNPIRTVSSVKYLGVTITHDLSWKTQSCQIPDWPTPSLIVTRHVTDVISYGWTPTPQARHTIYKSAILPKLEYCCSVWDPHSTTLTNELEKTQKFAGRVITKNWNSDYMPPSSMTWTGCHSRLAARYKSSRSVTS